MQMSFSFRKLIFLNKSLPRKPRKMLIKLLLKHLKRRPKMLENLQTKIKKRSLLNLREDRHKKRWTPRVMSRTLWIDFLIRVAPHKFQQWPLQRIFKINYLLKTMYKNYMRDYHSQVLRLD